MTKDRKYTPGPWKLGVKNSAATSIFGSDGELVIGGEYDGLMCPFVCRADETAIANAALVSAAPEMYEALKEALRRFDMDAQGNIVEIERVLAKAEGK